MVKKATLNKLKGTAMGKCPECGRKLGKTEISGFHYTGYGVENVYLERIIEYKCRGCD